MVKLEDIQRNKRIIGLCGAKPCTIRSVEWSGTDALYVTYSDASGKLDEVIVYRGMEPELSLDETGASNFSANAHALKLVSEAYRISLASAFDPYIAVRTSAVQPLPHQMSAVYQEMLPRLPLRYVLADDPGAGKTIMTGLLVKEMIARGDLERCLIVCPGSLCEQWQDELLLKFGLRFEILTNDRLEAAATRNAFDEISLAIARLDKLARDESCLEKLKKTTWDLVVCDEAHKMSATLASKGEVKATKRYRLGQLLSSITENLLLLTATPHNGKAVDFQLFMALVDPDRFGAVRGGSQAAHQDVSDCMRRLVKEDLLTFEGKPLFPERIAQTVNYELSPEEAALYEDVTEYVTSEFNRAERLDGQRKHSVGFALTMLQRRLASSPEAIYQSLHRRRKRLASRMVEIEQGQRTDLFQRRAGEFAWDMFNSEDFDEDDIPLAEREGFEDDVTDSASAAATVQELEAEIRSLELLETRANEVRMSGRDRKWEELSSLLQDNACMFGPDGEREKLIIFTEHKDTLQYLAEKIASLLGDERAVLTIKGGMNRDARRAAEQAFRQDPEVRVLIATDAAGEGINLQRAHLMVNYDLPWNPNRIEQRFGRIHRIGQTEVCHLWNLVAAQTREGEVFQRLFAKLEEERLDLGGRVFDVLGKVTFENRPLKELLLEAIRYGRDPDVRRRLDSVVDESLSKETLQKILDEHALSEDSMNLADVMSIKEDMERAEMRKLEPHYLRSFFLNAMNVAQGRVANREPGRYEVLRVPRDVQKKAPVGEVLKRYERVCFDRDLVRLDGAPEADLLHPGHPLMKALVSWVLDEFHSYLDEGSILIDPEDWGDEPRLLFYLETEVRDGTPTRDGKPHVVSRELRFVELGRNGEGRSAGYAPYLDYQEPTKEEAEALLAWAGAQPFAQDAERIAKNYAVANIVQEHVGRIKKRRLPRIEKVEAAVRARRNEEIRYWDERAWHFSEQMRKGAKNAQLNYQNAVQRSSDMADRFDARLDQLELEKSLTAGVPRITGRSLVIPRGLLAEIAGTPVDLGAKANRATVEAAGMAAVMRIERDLGYEPRDRSRENVGYDIESSAPAGTSMEGLRFIEVKGRVAGADTVTVSRNEVLSALNNPERFLLALVEVTFDGDGAVAKTQTTYLRKPFHNAIDSTANCVVFDIQDLKAKAEVVLEREDVR